MMDAMVHCPDLPFRTKTLIRPAARRAGSCWLTDVSLQKLPWAESYYSALGCAPFPGAACIQHGRTKAWPLPWFRTAPELPGELMEASLQLHCNSTSPSAQPCLLHSLTGSVPESTCQKKFLDANFKVLVSQGTQSKELTSEVVLASRS